MPTWDEHLKWCKDRARVYAARGELANAVASMGSDIMNHDDFNARCPDPHLLVLGMMLAVTGDDEGVRMWIEGFR
jgi:hypothetical protein